MAMSRSLGSRWVTSRSSNRMAPPWTSSKPAMQLSKVDFPHPDGPSSTVNDPSGILSERSCSTGTSA